MSSRWNESWYDRAKKAEANYDECVELLANTQREVERLRALIREVKANFSLAMPFVESERGSEAQRLWHERAALEEET
ncbi:MAG: hypothetical protein ACRDIC_06010 [bacterium]